MDRAEMYLEAADGLREVMRYDICEIELKWNCWGHVQQG